MKSYLLGMNSAFLKNRIHVVKQMIFNKTSKILILILLKNLKIEMQPFDLDKRKKLSQNNCNLNLINRLKNAQDLNLIMQLFELKIRSLKDSSNTSKIYLLIKQINSNLIPSQLNNVILHLVQLQVKIIKNKKITRNCPLWWWRTKKPKILHQQK